MKVYGLSILLRKTFTGMVGAVKHIDYMDFEGEKEVAESPEFDEFCLRQFNVVVLQISQNDIHETTLSKGRYINVF